MSLTPADLRKLAETDILVHLMPEQYGPALAQPPFINVEGTFNVRDLGLLPGSAPTKIRPGFAFRSGMLNQLTPAGKTTLADDLGVRRIFDLRSQSEHSKGADPVVSDKVTNVWDLAAEATPHVSLEPFVEGLGETGYVDMYLGVLRAYRPTIKLVLEHVRDRPSEPFLFHCTAGRDRTGVVSGLLLALAGEDRDTISLDYLLTRIGMEPVRELLEAFALRESSNAGSAASSGGGPPPGFLNLLNLREECWNAFQGALAKEYGGYEGYVKSALGFSEEDVATIKKNLTVEA